MTIKMRASLNKQQADSLARLLKNHAFANPDELMPETARKISEELSKDAKKVAPVETGKMKRTIKPYNGKGKPGPNAAGINLQWYFVFSNYKTKWLSRVMGPDNVADLAVKAIESE